MTNSEKLHMHIQLIKEEMKMSFTYPDELPDDMDEYPEEVIEDEEDDYDEYPDDEEEPDTAFEDETPLEETIENESIEEPIPDTSEEEGREYITYDEV